MAKLVYEIAIESEGIYFYKWGTKEIPATFVDKILETKKHSARIQRLMTLAIAKEVEKNESIYLEPSPEETGKTVLGYNSLLRDFDYIINDYVEQEYDKKFPEPPSPPTAEEIINKLDSETLSKQIFLTQVLSARYNSRSKTSKLKARKEKDKSNAKLLKTLASYLKLIQNNQLDFTNDFEVHDFSYRKGK